MPLLTEHEVRQRANEKKPTRAQLSAGNYAKTHWKMHGLDIAIENLAGTKRSGVNPQGQPWEVVMPYHYGYVKGTEGADGDHLDIAVGPLMNRGSEAHIFNQTKGRDKGFDEHKVFIGYPTREDAIASYRAGRSDNPDDVMGTVITVPIEELKRWIDEGNLKREAVLKAHREQVTKAEGKVHVKHHFRNINGKVVYVPDYDKTVHGDHPEASLAERTIVKQTKHGHTVQLFDAEDNAQAKAAMEKAGLTPHLSQHTGATHHGVKKSVFQHHFKTMEEAAQLHDMLKTEQELEQGLGGGIPAPKKKLPGKDMGPKAGPDDGHGKAPEPESSPLEDAELLAHGLAAHFGEVWDIEGGQAAVKRLGEVVEEIQMAQIDPDAKTGIIGNLLSSTGMEFADKTLGESTHKMIANMDDDHQFSVYAALAAAHIKGDPSGVKMALSMMHLAGKAVATGEPYQIAAAAESASTATVAGVVALNGIFPSVGWSAAVKAEFEPAVSGLEAIKQGIGALVKTAQDGTTKSLQSKGYVDPSLYDMKIHAMEIAWKVANGAGDPEGSKEATTAISELKVQKIEAQKTKDYTEADALATGDSAGSLWHEGSTEAAINTAKLTAVIFKYKANAAQKMGQMESLSKYMTGAKNWAQQAVDWMTEAGVA